MKNKAGFSLVELIIAIVIIGILSLISGATYKGYVNRAAESEANALLADINAAQEVYFIKNKQYYDSGSSLTSSNNTLGVQYSKNKYFTGFKCSNSSSLTTQVKYRTNTYKNKTYEIYIRANNKPLISKV